MNKLTFSVLAFFISSSALASTGTCKLLIQPESKEKFSVVEMARQNSTPGEIGLVGSDKHFSVILNGADDLSDVAVQVIENGKDVFSPSLMVNGAKNADGVFSIGATINGRALSLTCKVK